MLQFVMGMVLLVYAFWSRKRSLKGMLQANGVLQEEGMLQAKGVLQEEGLLQAKGMPSDKCALSAEGLLSEKEAPFDKGVLSATGLPALESELGGKSLPKEQGVLEQDGTPTLGVTAGKDASDEAALTNEGFPKNADRLTERLKWSYIWFGLGLFLVVGSVFGQMFAFFVLFVLTGVCFVSDKFFPAQKEVTDGVVGLPAYAAGFFPLVAVIFVFRAFLFEPFVIPSSSMRPVLEVGDVVLVKKFSNGIRNPLTNKVWWHTAKLERGDVIVFRYPENPRVNYIKRVVGVAGDVVEYTNKKLRVNGEWVPEWPKGMDSFLADGTSMKLDVERYAQELGAHRFDIYKMAGRPSVWMPNVKPSLTQEGYCRYMADGSSFECRVPRGHTFVMGDNRDNSADSRYWGFVPDSNVVGVTRTIVLNVPKVARMLRSID